MDSQKHHQGDLFTFDQRSETEPIKSKLEHQNDMEVTPIYISLT